MLLSAEPTRGEGPGPTAIQAEKRRSNLYTPERRNAALENVQNYTWAADRRASAVETATAYLEAYGGLDGLWQAVTGQSVPRNVALSATAEEIARSTTRASTSRSTRFRSRPSRRDGRGN
ncbi:hypothetical protein ACFQMM_03090 [Saliphagus sp. GCM10025308]